MNHYKTPLILLGLIIIACTVSCKKKGGSPPFSDLRIATVMDTHQGAVTNYRIVYDQYNDVDSIVYLGSGAAAGTFGYDVISYFGTDFSVTDANNNSFTVYGNPNGMIVEVLVPDTLVMNYNSSDQLDELDTKTPTTYPLFTVSSVYYNWANGDLINYGPSGSTSGTYYYDLSHSGQPGDPQRIKDFLNYGRSYIKSAHLVKGLINSSSDTISAYYYQFNSLGQVSQLMVVNDLSGVHDTETYNYQYY